MTQIVIQIDEVKNDNKIKRNLDGTIPGLDG